MAYMWQLSTLKCVISGKPYHVASPEKFHLAKILNGRLVIIVNFNMLLT